MELSKIGTYKCVAEPFHVDFTGRLFMGVLGNHLLNAADFHADDRGFGIGYLNTCNKTWVLSRLAINLQEMPRAYENITIQTWVEKVVRYFTVRNFSITGDDGKIYGYARSIWAMIDLDTRKPADLLSIRDGALMRYIEPDKLCSVEKANFVRVKSETPVNKIVARYGDIDINGHVNSVKYIEHLIDLFPKEKFEQQHIRQFAIAYATESYYGDELGFFVENASADDHHIEVRRNGGEVVCRSHVVFAP